METFEVHLIYAFVAIIAAVFMSMNLVVYSAAALAFMGDRGIGWYKPKSKLLRIWRIARQILYGTYLSVCGLCISYLIYDIVVKTIDRLGHPEFVNYYVVASLVLFISYWIYEFATQRRTR